METIGILALVLALAATILAFVFIVPEKKRNNLNGLGKILHDTVNFKYLIVEKVLQALYIFATALVILAGFFMLFWVEEYRWGDSKWHVGEGLLLMIFGPIAVRLAFEFVLMFVLLVKNVVQINNKLKANCDQPAEDVFANPVTEAPAASANAFCTACGAKVDGNSAFCTTCGAKIDGDSASCTTCSAEVDSDSAFCTACGAKVDGNSAFCTTCGAKLN